ncbi:MAG: histidine kinase [Actinomycetota bacterium]
MSDRVRPVGWVAATVAGTSTALIVVWAVAFFATGTTDDPELVVIVTFGAIGLAVVGATIAARTGNGVGWAMLAVVGSFAVSAAGGGYASYANVADRTLPGTTFAAWIGTLTFFLSLMLIVAIPMLYPTGTPRWPWVWRLYLATVTVMTVGFAILPQELSVYAGRGPQNPIAIDSWKPLLDMTIAIAGCILALCALLAVASLVVRYRRSKDDERQQLRWLAYVGVAAVVSLALAIVAAALWSSSSSAAARSLSSALLDLTVAVVLFGIPAACAIAIFRYHLYDLDLVIRKTVVVGAMALFITLIYALIVGLGSQLFDSSVLSFVAAAVLAVGFQPARDRARKLADRLVYGERATPYEVLADFSGRMGEAYAADDVLPRMAQVLAAGTGAEVAVVWLRLGDELHPSAMFPADSATPADVPADAVDVVHQGEHLGSLSVTMPPSDPMDPARHKLVEDLAAQAGLVLRNVRLIGELRASRQRLVAAQDEERRRLERNLHDGAQQQLVALSIQLKLARTMLDRDPAKTGELLDGLQTTTGDAIEDLRDLARGIYPPLLADKGLPTALEAQSKKAAVPITVTADGVVRYSQEVEAAVYFSCLEAMNNIVKYADATCASVSLAQADGHLTFVVADDGRGFDPNETGYGTGLQGIADRLDAIGGTLAVVSRIGTGTTMTGTVPAAPR